MKPLSNSEDIIPLYDRVLVEIPKIEEKTKGGIILPDSSRAERERRECRAVILAIGPLAYHDHPEDSMPQVGDVVLIPRHAGKYYEADGKTEFGLRLIHADEALAIVRNKQGAENGL